MPDEPEHESAIAAWLESPDTRREMKVLHDRFPRWNEYEITTVTLLVELMVALNIYGRPTLFEVVDGDAPEPEKPGWIDDDEEGKEPWQT